MSRIKYDLAQSQTHNSSKLGYLDSKANQITQLYVDSNLNWSDMIVSKSLFSKRMKNKKELNTSRRTPSRVFQKYSFQWPKIRRSHLDNKDEVTNNEFFYQRLWYLKIIYRVALSVKREITTKVYFRYQYQLGKTKD